jgi:adenosylcobinamide-GDP ribazoletransferase
MFYTRIPCPPWVDHSAEYLNKATRYFPLMGWIVGGTAALVLWGGAALWPIPVAVMLSTIAGVWLTGAFHEDGLADVADGYGGGWSAQQILEIMKDSRVGAFGALGLMLILLLKLAALAALASQDLHLSLYALWLMHSLSRLAATWMIFAYPYARADEQSKAKPVAQRMPLPDLLLAHLWGAIPLGLGLYWLGWTLLLVPLAMSAGFAYLAQMYLKWTGGYTGDGLGSVQQVTEVLGYLGLLALIQA